VTRAHQLRPAQLSRLLEVGRTLVATLDLEDVLPRVLEAGRELTGARYAALGVLDSEKRALERFLPLGIDDETRIRIGPLPRGHGLLGELIRDPRVLRLADISDHPRSSGFPREHPPMTTFLGAPVRIRDEVYGNIYLTDKDGGAEFTEGDEELLVVLAEWAAIAIDNARSHHAGEARRVELERAVRALRATADLDREVERETDLDRVLELIVKRGRTLVDARACALLLLTGDREMHVAAAAGEASAVLVGRSLEDPNPALDVVRAGVGQRIDGPAMAALAAQGLEGASALLIPLRSRGVSLGALVAIDRIGASPRFGQEDEAALGSFAASAAGAIDATRAHGDEKARTAIRASEQERRRWARELHDETLQELGALKMAQERALASGDQGEIERTLRDTLARVDGVIDGLGSLITELRPAALDQLGTAAAIETLADRVRQRHSLAIELDIELDYEAGRAGTRHEPELEATIYRLVQESLTNVVKHAEASRARVAVEERDGRVLVTVEDDGRGMAAGSRDEGGFGLIGMRERVALAGGEIEVGPGARGGTRVRASLPTGIR